MKAESRLVIRLFLSACMLVLTLSAAQAQNSANVLNRGVPGNSSADLLNRVVTDVISHKPDLVIIQVGANDLLNTRKMISVAEYYDNMDQLTDRLLQHDIKLALVSSTTVDTQYLFERHDASRYPKPPMQLLALGRDTLQSLCQDKGLLFIDLFAHLHKMGVPCHNQDHVIMNQMNSGRRDGGHLTAKGNRLLALLIYEQLKESFPDLADWKIICFGDSITFGVFMDGEGTTDGDTYPAVLKRLIREQM
ncbi:GDSL-type esterase/lipase family protein [Sunxiuqinia sp. sy24]|uniref:GDSL-type esterase/lipase family protein n=1 Tax=Sunxiuqinia sp. sy24 TaxID=3461495 RepID=UPI00404569F2